MAKTQLRLRDDLRTLRQGSLDEVERLLAGFKNLASVRDRDGLSIKQHLLLRSDVDVLPLLAKVGLPVGQGDLDDATRISGPQVLVRLKALQALGIDLRQPVDRGNTVMHRLVQDFGTDTPAALDWLMDQGVPVDARNEQGDTVLHLLVSRMNDYQIGQMDLLMGAGAGAMFDQVMGMMGMGAMAQQVRQCEQSLRALQEAWVERFIAAGLDPFDPNHEGCSAFDLVPHKPGGFDRLFARRDQGFPARTEAERRIAEHSPANVRLIERMEALAGRSYASTRKENVLEDLEVEVRNPDGSFSTLR